LGSNVIFNPDAKLLHMVGALGAARRLPRCLNRGNQQRHQDADDRDDYQQFD
jgi:hypothetical protein